MIEGSVDGQPGRAGAWETFKPPKETPRPAATEGPARQLKLAVGAALKTARGARTLRDVAGQLGWIAHVNLLRLEAGDINPTLERLAKVAAAYGGHLEVTFVPDVGDD